MTQSEARDALLGALAEIAPEADGATLDGSVELAEQLDIDSMDFLNFVIAVNERTGIDIPESDYASLATLDGCLEYLSRAANY
jgi:acyl carrier protein